MLWLGCYVVILRLLLVVFVWLLFVDFGFGLFNFGGVLEVVGILVDGFEWLWLWGVWLCGI